MTRRRPRLSRAATIRVAVYLVAGVVGGLLTYRFNSQWSDSQNGFDLADYVRAGFANSASTSFGIDLIVAAVTGVLFMAVEGARLRMRSTIVLIVSTFVIAFAFAFPVFLAFRELRLAEPDAPAGPVDASGGAPPHDRAWAP